MRIIKPGQLPVITQHGTCGHCGCEVECELTEGRKVKCPTVGCPQSIPLKSHQARRQRARKGSQSGQILTLLREFPDGLLTQDIVRQLSDTFPTQSSAPAQAIYQCLDHLLTRGVLRRDEDRRIYLGNAPSSARALDQAAVAVANG